MLEISTEGKLIIDPGFLAVKQAREVWNSDKTKTKEKAYNVLSGIYLLCNPKSAYWGYPEEEKFKQIEEQYFKPYGFKIKDTQIQDLIKQYEDFIKITPSQYLLEAAKETLYKLANHLKKTPITSGKDGNILQISNTMDKIAKTFASYDTLKEAIEKEKLSSGIKRGNQEFGYDEE
jgi:hypothetical protein